jgi:hypothetical protein
VPDTAAQSPIAAHRVARYAAPVERVLYALIASFLVPAAGVLATAGGLRIALGT